MDNVSVFRPNYKRTLLILASVLLIIGICLFLFLPHSTPVSVSVAMVKLDAEGNALGTVDFVMTGSQKDYLFRGGRLDVTFSDFEGLTLLNNGISHPDGMVGRIFNDPVCGFYYIVPSAYNPETNSLQGVALAFSEDYDYLLLANDTTKEYYYACVSGKATAQELIEYFAPFGVQKSRPAK